jgi:neutral/alkaline ceramidase-like enzyme
LACAVVALALLAVVFASDAAAATPATYEVGLATRTINPTAPQIATNKVYLGGFGFGSPPVDSGRPATGVLGEGASVRAFVVSDGTHTWAIADMEVQGWFVATKDGPYGIIDMRREVERLTHGELGAEQVIVQSDHSHSGPDGMGVWGGLPLAYRQYIFAQTVSAIVDAYNARRPGQLYYGTAKGNGLAGKPDLLNNQFSTDPANQTLDDDVRVLQARDPSTGDAFATMLDFSAHGTVLGSSNTKVSGDWPQRTNPMLEQKFGGQAMTVVGTLGRTQPNRPGCGDATKTGDAKYLCELDTYSERVVDRAQLAVDNATPITGDAVVAARSYLIQDPAHNALLLGAGAVGDPLGVPLNRSLLPPWLTGNVIGTITATARVGDVLLSSVPGEIYPQIALKVRDVIEADHGARGFMTAGLANDQLGYIIAPFPEAYTHPVCNTVLENCDFDQVGPLPSKPLPNDNYFFNVSHTMGERVTCSLLRGAGEVLGKGMQYRDAYEKCAAFANDLAFGHRADVGCSEEVNSQTTCPELSPDAGGGTTTGGGPSGQVKAGVGVVDASWHVGASAGQYAHERDPTKPFEDPSQHATIKKASYGVQARLQARAIVVEGGDGKRIALVKNDLYIPQDLLYRRTAQILEQGDSGITRANLTMAVTHDHSSPYYSSTAPGAWTFQDVFDVRFYDYYAKQMAHAVEEAAAHMKPVRVGASVGRLDKPHRNSMGPSTADDGTPSGYPNSDSDHDLTVIRFDDISDPGKPKPLAQILNYSLHPEFLDGNELISADYVGPLQRMVDRKTKAVTIFTQSSVGTSEPERSSFHSVHERLEFTHKQYAQAEYGARLIADKALQVWGDVASGTPELPGRFVPFDQAFPVTMTDRWYAGPVSHPYPGVGSCRSDPLLAGDPRIPVAGLPDCQNGQGVLDGTADFFGLDNPIQLPSAPISPGVTTDDIQAAGIPFPDNYSAPSYGALEEDLDVHLQVFRLGDILFTICPCEQWADQARNIKSRTDVEQKNQYLGYNWAARCTEGSGGDWTCPNPRNESENLPPISDAKYQKMKAQVGNDAKGWDFLKNAPFAESEPANPDAIKGNYTHEELGPGLGYKLTVPVTMANDYNGYIATYREYQRGDHYRKALTGWGPHSSDYLATRLVQLGGHLKDPANPVLPTENERELADAVGRPKVEADLANNDARAETLGRVGAESVAAYEQSLPDDGGVAEVVTQPADVERFGAALFSWNGGSNFTDNPQVMVERAVGAGWEPYADQSGELPVTLTFPAGEDVASYEQGNQKWKWTAHFEAFVSRFDTGERPVATPPGKYRFVVDGLRRSGGSAVPYHLTSREFSVKPWSGITVDDVRVDAGGLVSFKVGPRHVRPVVGGGGPNLSAEIGPIDYPDSYKSPIPFIKEERTFVRDPAAPGDVSKLEWYCLACSFRPWIDVGDASSAVVTVVHTNGSREPVPASLQGGRWVAARAIGPFDAAFVGSGCVVDKYGDYNGAASTAVGGGAPALGKPAGGCAASGRPPGEPGGGNPGGGNPGGGNPGSGNPGGGPRGRCRDQIRPRSTLRARDVRERRGVVTVKGHSSDRGCKATATLSGRSGKVARVYISLARVQRGGRCRFLGHNGRLGRWGSCRRWVFFRARGTSSWRLTLRGTLPRGKYRVVARAYDAAGNKEQPAHRNIVRFTIR